MNKILLFTLALIFSGNVLASSSAYQLCLDEASKKHDLAVQREKSLYLMFLKECFHHPYETDRYDNCVMSMEYRYNANLLDLTRTLNADKLACQEISE